MYVGFLPHEQLTYLEYIHNIFILFNSIIHSALMWGNCAIDHITMKFVTLVDYTLSLVAKRLNIALKS